MCKRLIDEELENIIRQFPEKIMITVHDRDFNIVSANDRAKEVLHLPSLEGKEVKCYKYYHNTDSPHENCETCKSLITCKPETFQSYEPHLKGSIKIRGIPLFDPEHKFIGSVHFAWDVPGKRIEKPSIT